VIPGTDPALSLVAVPIIGSDRVLGVLAMEDYERENAYGEAELRLLQRWLPALAWRWRTRAYSTRPSAC